MNRKMFIPIFALVAILPAIGIVSYSEDDSQTLHNDLVIPKTDKFLQITSSDEIAYTLPERVDASDLVIQGKILSVHPKAQLVDPEHKTPWLFTVATVQIDKVLKGETNQKTIQVQLFGGETEDRITVVDRLDIKQNDSVVMFLGKDPDSIFGNNYGVIGEINGMYLIEGDMTKHHVEDRPLPLDKLLEAISKANQSQG